MENDLICPECSGVIGGSGAGRRPCVCLQPAPTVAPPLPALVRKTCCRCGKDVEGQERYKDDFVYWCRDCYQRDVEIKARGKEKCTKCREYFRKEEMRNIDGTLYCDQCYEQWHKEAKERLFTVGVQRIHKNYDWSRIWVLLGIMAVLLVFMILSWLKK